MIVLGLTGSIGMGKSTAAAMLRRLGCPVHDADATVHRLYAPGGAAVVPIQSLFPQAVRDGAVDRAALSTAVLGNQAALQRLEALVHPLVQKASRDFLRLQARRGVKLVVMDIPLLYETGGRARVDQVLVVSAPRFLQRSRVLVRPGMDAVKLDRILARQMPDALKRRLADYTVPTGLGRAVTFRQLARIVRALRLQGGGQVWPPRRGPRDRMSPFLSRWKKPHA